MILRIVHGVFGLIFLGNGLFMLVSPQQWFEHGPAGVPNTGPFNMHFVRDVGVVYALVGLALMWSAAVLAHAKPVHVMTLMFLAGHAALHVYDILVGNLPMAHWRHDFLGVFFPAVLFGVMLVPGVWARSTGTHRSPPKSRE
jgi:hypothetical protein